jgi:phytoene synthase
MLLRGDVPWPGDDSVLPPSTPTLDASSEHDDFNVVLCRLHPVTQRARRCADHASTHDPETPAATAVEEWPVDAAYEYCRQIAKHIARTFYYGSLFLPAVKRRAAWAIYAFCRTADDIADDPDLYPDAASELARWRDALLDVYSGCPRGPVMTAWADMLRTFPVPLHPALELLDGVRMDIAGARYDTFEDLRLYCYRVAGTVGLLMTPVLGYEAAEALDRAVDLGIAMQLTNILRDIGQDVALGRIYLPAGEMERFGYSRDDLADGVINDAFLRLIEFQIARAEDYYRRGMGGLALLKPEVRLAIALSGTLYRAILHRIRRNRYDVFTRRAYIPLAGKLAAVPETWLRLRLARL